MRLYTVTIICRVDDDEDAPIKPEFSVHVDVEDGVPGAVVSTIPHAVQNVGKQMEEQMNPQSVTTSRESD